MSLDLLDKAIDRALTEPTLLDALTSICVWESERVVRQARANVQWETCFRALIKHVMTAWAIKEGKS